MIYPYICDFFCSGKALIVEVDGDTHDPLYDATRDTRLAAAGFVTVRFTNVDVCDNPDGVLTAICNALADRPDRWTNPRPQT